MKNQSFLFFILLSSCLTLVGCSSDVKDYWEMRDPSIVIVEESGHSQTFFNPKSLDLSNTKLEYGSHLKFSDINKDVTFDISTKCFLNNKVFTAHHEEQKIYQNLYFYNFLPLHTIATDRNSNAQEFQCDFHIVAKNSIGSKFTYDLPNLVFNTIRPNRILIGLSIDDDDFSSNSYIQGGYIDTSNIDAKHTSAVIIDNSKSFLDTHIICEDHVFTRQNPKNYSIREFSINDFFHKPEINTLDFYKKCRVITTTTKFISALGGTESDVDHERLWSPYFDVIVNKPKISITAEFVDSSHSYYTDNNQSFAFTFAQLTLKNNGYVPAFVKFNTSSKAQVAVAYRNTTHLGFAPPSGFADVDLIKNGMPTALLKGSLETRLNFISESGEDSNLIDLSTTGVPATVLVQLEKNFSCSIYQNKETGLWLKAIQPYSDDDKIEVYVVVNNALEKFPMPYYISELLDSSSLNMMNSSQYVFEGMLLPKLRSSSFRYMENHDAAYRSTINAGVNNNKYLGSMSRYLSYLNKPWNHSKFCRIYPSSSPINQ